MKHINEHIVSEKVNLTYRAQLNGSRGSDGLPITVTIELDDAADVKAFEKWLDEELGNSIARAGGGPRDEEWY